MLPQLEGYAAAVFEELGSPERQSLVTELDSLDVAVRSRGDLRAALTDTSIPPTVRAAVLSDLLTGKLSATAVRLATYAARAASGQDLPAVLSELTHYAVTRARDEDVAPSPLSLLQARKRVSGFADAVLESLATTDFANVEDDLFRWARTVESTAELRRILTDRDAPISGRVTLTSTLLQGKVTDASLRLAIYAVTGGRARDIVGTLDHLVDYVARARDWRVARVWTARALDDAPRRELAASLRVITGHDVELQVVEDDSLLGGVLVQVGDLRLDATTKGRLVALREAITTDVGRNELANLNR